MQHPFILLSHKRALDIGRAKRVRRIHCNSTIGQGQGTSVFSKKGRERGGDISVIHREPHCQCLGISFINLVAKRIEIFGSVEVQVMY